MTTSASNERKALVDDLPEARVRDVVQAVGEALKGEGSVSLTDIDPDGETLEAALEKAVEDALTISPRKALLNAWKGLDQVADLISPKGPMDDKPRQVTIANHSLKASFEPQIVLEFGKVAEVRRLPVPVTFALKIEGLIVTVTNRRIVSVAAGRAKPSVTVKVEDVTVLKQKLPTIDLPIGFKQELQSTSSE